MSQTIKLSELAEQAYAAYAESTGGKNFQGNPMPLWNGLPEPIQRAWIASTSKVVEILYSAAIAVDRT